jgi:hypothetical protein
MLPTKRCTWDIFLAKPAHWGQGLATEVLRGLVDHLRATKFQGTIHAGVRIPRIQHLLECLKKRSSQRFPKLTKQKRMA